MEPRGLICAVRIWWIRYKVPGDAHEKFESSKSTNKQDAVRLLNRRRKEIDDRQVTTGEATVGRLLQKHLADSRKQGRKDYRSVEDFVGIRQIPRMGILLRFGADEPTSHFLAAVVSTEF